MKIVIVDDQRAVRVRLAAMVEKMGHEVFQAEDGERGVEMWERERPDLVLMDALMPVLDGYAAARRIRALEPDGWTPIIFLSSAEADQDVERGIDSGGDDYLVKPVSRVVLSAKIRAMQRIDDMRRRMGDMTRSLAEANRELARLNNEDVLTGLANRRCFDESLRAQTREAHRAERPLSLVMVDVDFFKPYNDHLGHQAGDECLRSVARVLETQRDQPVEVAARYGGEEFALILPGHDAAGALARAERLRLAVESLHLPHVHSAAGQWVTVSVGVSTLRSATDDGAWMLAEADASLYRAKRSGRNCVVAWR
jgi:diguanylate cyclase (GGDEF)-like protein